ncbi:MAG: NUDIX domain-containing protein [Patescibacteria group bacterium]
MKRTRATAVVLRENKLLMIHRFKNGEEYFVLPGGTTEDNETVEEAALRELKEETSLHGTVVKNIARFSDDFQTEHQLFLIESLTGEVCLSENSIEASIMNKDNSFEPVWVSIDEIGKLKIYPGKTKETLLKYFNLHI